ncbi:acyl-CoA dehydrogenase [Variovorax sp. WS11]|uniref:acyl-CoA dehydrogenase family protein n=1 Tax=Variovorax sp. WS11 TaxID=1105204 RepID=UPI000D0D7A36|nr:acyl-CoA dehydrogenase family protein [Variovorax sp. WS11]NDZ15742.1 isovaleryl-CoA dehydrogenase [Variovorax sp. WS11]PSL82893.1 acyl-CoA dehydrogenase [Variovorax sp. WS11]
MSSGESDASWALLRVPLPAAAEEIRQEARAFANREIAPRAQDIDAKGRIPADLWPKLGEAGLLGVTVPARFGGAGLGYLEHLVVMEEISRASAAVGLSYLVHSHACTNQIALYGTDAQKERLLPDLVNGTRVGGLAITEPQAGSDALGAMATTAGRIDGGFVLSGHKAWIANAPCADVLVVYARTDRDARGKGMTAFALELPRAGAIAQPPRATMGVRGCQVGDVVFDNCRATAADVLGEVDGGAAVMMDGLERERFVASGGPLGLLQSCLDAALSHSVERQQFGQAIGNFQLIQAKLADMVARTNAARSYAYTAGVAGDFARGGACDGTALLMFAAEQAMAASREVLQLMGAAGFAEDSVAARLYRDAQFFTLGFGTSEIRRIVIGRSLATRAQARGELMGSADAAA